MTGPSAAGTPSPRRARRRVAGSVLVVVAGLALWSGCASSVRPPASVEDPVTVHLLATGRHSGLLLPRPAAEGGAARLVEYGYGDWGWWALCEDDWWRAPATMLWPNPGTLGRREVPVASISTAPGAYQGGTLSAFVVPRRAAEELLARLDGEFAAGGGPHFNRTYDMWFVPHGERFWMFHDCHDEAAEWLRALGCEVGWAPVRTGLDVEGD